MGTDDTKDPPTGKNTPKEGDSSRSGQGAKDTPNPTIIDNAAIKIPIKEVINLYQQKVFRMSDSSLVSECMIFLHMLESNKLSKENKTRAETLFKAASERKSLEANRDDFLIALRVLRHL